MGLSVARRAERAATSSPGVRGALKSMWVQHLSLKVLSVAPPVQGEQIEMSLYKQLSGSSKEAPFGKGDECQGAISTVLSC